MMRPEVEEALRRAGGPMWDSIVRWGDSLTIDNVEAVEDQLRALIELGVRLGLADAANHLRLHSNPGHADFLLERVTVASVLEGK